MYKNFYYDRKTNRIHLWTDGKHNDKEYEVFDYKKYAYVVDSKGEHTTLTGLKVKKVTSWGKEAEKAGMVFEHDVPVSTRTLIDRYYETDDVAVNLTVLFFDIEVEKGLRYSTAKEAKNKITSIAYYDTKNQKYVCLLLDEKGKLTDCKKQIKVTETENTIEVYVKVYRKESELLQGFVSHWNKIKPDMVTGWNCVSKGTYVTTEHGLEKIENLKNGIKLATGTANLVFPTGLKREWIVENHIGTILNCSGDHIFPCYIIPKGRYIDTKSINQFRDELSVSEINQKLDLNECVIKVPKLTNNRPPLTFKKLLLDNFDIFKSYDKFDFYVKNAKIVQFVKENPGLFPSITKEDRWSKYAGNKWRYRSLANLPESFVLEFLKSVDVIDFAFGTNARTKLDITQEISGDFMQLLGLIYTDGHYSKRRNAYNICNKDEKIIRHYVDIMLSSKIKKTYHFNRQNRDQCFYVECPTQNYLGFLFPLIYHHTGLKNLNVELLSQLSYNQFQSFFSGLIDGDGSVSNNVVSIGNWETKIENNINSLQQLLFSNGILSTIFSNNLRIRAKGQNNSKFINGLNIVSSTRSANHLNFEYGGKTNSKTKKYRYFETDTDYLVKIRNIYETDSFCEMYDINTDVGYFQANSMLVHNCDVFDIPYLHNRIENVLGINYARKLSPIGITEERQVTKRDIVINIAGIAQMDYLQLYKKFTYNEESSYTLEAISQKELKRGKFKYNGTLDELYENDIDGFIEYNVNDVELIVSLDKKMDLIEIARGICHKGHVPYDDYSMSSKYLDGAIQTRCHRKNLITVTNLTKTINFVADVDEIFIKIKKQYISLREVIKSKLNLVDKTKVFERIDDDYELVGIYYTKNQKKSSEIIITSNKAKGAFVKPPNVGIHKWVYSIDAQSLYPSLIITMNNSLETQVASIQDWDKYDLNSHNLYSAKLSTLENFGYLPDDVILTINPIVHELFSERDTKPLQLNKQQFIDYVKSFDGTVSSRGVIFTTKKRGIIPEILDEWFDERQMFKKKMKDYAVGSELYIYYDRLQLITKILLNSLYGVLLLPTFRYYSKLSGESVTLSGQSVIKFADVLANLFYRRKLKDKHKTNCVIYQDSDSCYLDARPLIENFDNLSDYEKTVQTQLISNEVTEFVNTGIKWFASHCFHSNDNRLVFNQEKISKTAFWGQAKKRYAQLMMEVSGDKVIEKVKITGFDVVKSSFPKVFRKIMTEWIGDILQLTPISELNGKIRDFKKIYTQSKLTDIMLPTSVKEISKYSHGQKGTPIHIKSAQNYNKLLELHKIESLPPFDDGDKILYAYMRQNPYGFETMAIRGYDDPPEILEFVERFIDKEKVFNNTLISKLDTIWKDLGFSEVKLQEETNFF